MEQTCFRKKAEHKLFDCGGCTNNPKLKETLACFFVTTRFQKLAEEKLSGKPTKEFDRESAKAFVEERVPTSILNIYDESVAAESIRKSILRKKKLLL